ncbi:MAG: two-component regulator propeller domain-containing protein [Acidobacteriota bacterium]|nr:two-component regulator propeller domain-containing protein [Acidobacteriota bacterium]
MTPTSPRHYGRHVMPARRRQSWLLRYLCLALCAGLQAQVSAPRWQRLTTESGLSQNHVTCILQDRRGFMWFGTFDGLNRFDGYEFKKFRYDPLNPHSLSDSSVQTLYEDRAGALWIGTFEGGLNRFDRETLRFSVLKSDPGGQDGLIDTWISAMVEDGEGRLWIGTRKGLWYLDRQRKHLRKFQAGLTEPHGLNDQSITKLVLGQGGRLWIGTDGEGLMGLALDAPAGSTERLVTYRHDPTNPDSLSDDRIYALHRDRAGNLWIGTGGGLNVLVAGRDLSRRQVPAKLLGTAHGRIRAVYGDSRGRLWIGSRDAGLTRMGPAMMKAIGTGAALQPGARVQNYGHNPGDPTSLGGNHIRALYEDRGGTFWVGTAGGGLSKLDPGTEHFRHYKHEINNPNSLDVNLILALYEEPDKVGRVLWIGKSGGGLSRFDREQGLFRHYRHDPGDPGSLSNDNVYTIHKDRRGLLWIGTRYGLNRHDHRNERFVRFYHDPEDPTSLSSDRVDAVHEDRRGRLWIGTFGGLNRYDRAQNRFHHYRHDPNNPDSLGGDQVYHIYEDPRELGSSLWIGSNGGLTRVETNSAEPSFYHYAPDPTDPNSLSHAVVIACHAGDADTLWIGTLGGGLNRLDRTNKSFRVYRESDGLPNDTVYAILGDDQGLLWLSTNHGLSRFDPRSETFHNFDYHDGLQGNEFNMGAFFQSPGGELFFGGTNGFTAFFPARIEPNPHAPQIALTELLLYNQPVLPRNMDVDSPLQKSISETREFKLPHNHLFAFKFAALHYADPTQNRYAYKLEGLGEEWIETGGGNRYAVFTNLEPGSYRFRVKAANKDGVWSEGETAVKITIPAPFWKTPWAYLVYLAALAGSLLWYRENQRKIKKLLKRKVAERTWALNEKNRELASKCQELETFDSIVKTINREFELKAVIRSLLKQGLVLFPKAEKSSFLMLDPKLDKFRFVATMGYRQELLEDVLLSAEEVRKLYTPHELMQGNGTFIINDCDRSTARVQSARGLPLFKSCIAMAIPLDGELVGMLVLDNLSDADAFRESDVPKLERFREHGVSAVARAKVIKDLVEAQRELVEAAHLAGMAETAADVLHNVGNSLNSVQVSMQVIGELVHDNQCRMLLSKLAGLLREHQHDLAGFLSGGDRGAKLLDAVDRIVLDLARRDRELGRENEVLVKHMQNLRGVVEEQRKYTSIEVPRGSTDVNRLIGEALRMETYLFKEHKIVITLDLEDSLPVVPANKSRLLRVLLCLLKNAWEAIAELAPDQGRVQVTTKSKRDAVMIEIIDNGIGIPEENLVLIYAHGFTTKRDARGFGLHYCANAVGEMSGSIKVTSSGVGQGAVVCLLLPVAQADLSGNSLVPGAARPAREANGYSRRK